MHLLRHQLGHALVAVATILVAAALPGVGGEEARGEERGARSERVWDGQVVRWADGDTVWVARGEARGASDEGQNEARGASREARENNDSLFVKVRLHWSDAPEVARSKQDVGQAAGVAALEYARALWPVGTRLHIVPRGESYGRIVADVDCDGVDLALALTKAGWAWNDPRYKPPAVLRLAEAVARDSRRGLWDERKFGRAVPPWEWRKQKRREL